MGLSPEYSMYTASWSASWYASWRLDTLIRASLQEDHQVNDKRARQFFSAGEASIDNAGLCP